MRGARVTARFDDLIAGEAWVFGTPERVLTAHSLEDVPGLMADVDQRTRAGAWAWGYVSYEAAPAFDAAFRVRPPQADAPPLVSFAIGPAPRRERSIGASSNVCASPIGQWRIDWSAAQHDQKVRFAQAAIAAGDALQVNLSTRLYGELTDDPLAVYADMAHAQHGAYNAYIDIDGVASEPGRHVILSASPELFFRWDESGLTARPMKGTTRRGATQNEDARQRAELLGSAKQRAENVMIVDLVRNDLSRVAEVGSVRVQSLLEAEAYPTVWQLTSTVNARPKAGATLADVFSALFPCGSVTGAPKVAAMGLIAELETSPRGVYCGAVGMIGPPTSGVRARFSVPIRTAVLDRATSTVVYGSGGGITWDSNPVDEYDEILAKTAILGPRRDHVH